MIDKIYQIVHHYEVDGGFGDAVACEEIVATFADKNEAFEFKNKFENIQVYDMPYVALHCGKLIVTESDVIPKGGWNFSEEKFDWRPY